jgi:hypothetical protein
MLDSNPESQIVLRFPRKQHSFNRSWTTAPCFNQSREKLQSLYGHLKQLSSFNKPKTHCLIERNSHWDYTNACGKRKLSWWTMLSRQDWVSYNAAPHRLALEARHYTLILNIKGSRGAQPHFHTWHSRLLRHIQLRPQDPEKGCSSCNT